MSGQRKIIHIDADSFYASVEMRENPALRGKPVAVGGRSDRRGVIATSNYEARRFGVRSAMASSRALALCPDLLILPPQFDLYRAVSASFHEIFREYTEVIEPLSLDEAYLDVTDSEHFQGSATRIAEAIRSQVERDLALTVSAGIAPNKFLAKVASDWNKPDGLFTIAPEQVQDFVRDLPVNKINGVGKVMARKLGEMGVQTCGQLQAIPLTALVKRFGKYGQRLHDVARGDDLRPVQTSRRRKSISVERTYAQDITDVEGVVAALGDLLEELHRRFSKIEQRYFPVKRFVKIKYGDFTQTTLEELIGSSGESWGERAAFEQLMRAAWPRHDHVVRLLGVGLRLQSLEVSDKGQLPLFE